MKSRWLLNVGLLALLIALGLVAYFQPGAKRKPEQPAITNIDGAKVDTIRIEQPGHKTAVLKRERDHWQMEQPVNARADDSVITSLLDDIDESSAHHYPVKGLDLKQFGLKPPKLSLTLNNETLEFGSSDSLDHQRYIRNGDTVYLVNDTLFYRLQGDPLSMVSKRVLPKDAKITALDLPGIKLAQNSKGDWQLTPANNKITSDQIQKLVDAWNNADAYNVKAAGDAPVAGTVTVAIAGRDKPLKFEIEKNDSVLALVRPDIGVEYQLPANDRDDLLKLKPAEKPSNTSSNEKSTSPKK